MSQSFRYASGRRQWLVHAKWYRSLDRILALTVCQLASLLLSADILPALYLGRAVSYRTVNKNSKSSVLSINPSQEMWTGISERNRQRGHLKITPVRCFLRLTGNSDKGFSRRSLPVSALTLYKRNGSFLLYAAGSLAGLESVETQQNQKRAGIQPRSWPLSLRYRQHPD